MVLITLNKTDIRVPEGWNELTVDQLLEIMDTIYIRQYDPAQMVCKLFKILIGFSYRKFLKLNPEDIDEYVYLVKFLFEEKIGLTRQLLPKYEDLYGPDDEIGNMTGDEFVFAEHYHEQWWMDKKNDKALTNFVAIIYRPAKKNYDFEKNIDGDCRIQFNENISAYFADRVISHWPMRVKLAIATWYAGCRQKLVDDNEDVFGGKGEPAKYGLVSILRMIAEKGTYGTFEDVQRMPLSMMMIELNETIDEGRRLEQQMKGG